MVLKAVLILSAPWGWQAAAEPAPRDARCGAYCLYVALRALQLPIERFDELEAVLGQPSEAGYSLDQLSAAAARFGAKTLGVATSIENLQRREGRFACIIPLPSRHFMLITGVDEAGVHLADPPESSSTIPQETLRAVWDGTALLVSPDDLVLEEKLAATDWRRRAGQICVAAAVVVMLLALWRFRNSARQMARK